jgi:hypothetical protein
VLLTRSPSSASDSNLSGRVLRVAQVKNQIGLPWLVGGSQGDRYFLPRSRLFPSTSVRTILSLALARS